MKCETDQAHVTAQLGNADIIQPGLVQLQPNLDDFMDTLEPLPSLQGETPYPCYINDH